MQSPGSGVLGRLASKIMRDGNYKTIKHAVEKLGVSPTDCVVELGPGNGFGLAAIAKQKPSRLVGVEISQRFRDEIASLQFPIPVEIHNTDAKDMREFLSANSVDKIMAINVVYFLDPLSLYAAEFHRVLKSGGKGLLIMKKTALNGHDSYFINKNATEISSVFKSAGFKVTIEKIDLDTPISSYTAITVIK